MTGVVVVIVVVVVTVVIVVVATCTIRTQGRRGRNPIGNESTGEPPRHELGDGDEHGQQDDRQTRPEERTGHVTATGRRELSGVARRRAVVVEQRSTGRERRTGRGQIETARNR